MGDELVKVDANESLTLQKVGAGLFKSGLFPNAKNEYGAFCIVEYGHELGIPPMMSLKNINIISGQLAANAQLMLTLAMQRGVTFEVIEETTKGCKIEFTRGSTKYLAAFLEEDAKAAGLLGKDNWQKYPKDMYYWRATVKGVRRVAPDAVMGLYTPDEISEGKYINVEDIPIEAQVVEEPLKDPNKIIQEEIMTMLLELYGSLDKAEDELEKLTTWEKDGKTIKGKRSAFELSTKANAKGQTQTTVIHSKVKETYRKWKDSQVEVTD